MMLKYLAIMLAMLATQSSAQANCGERDTATARLNCINQRAQRLIPFMLHRRAAGVGHVSHHSLLWLHSVPR